MNIVIPLGGLGKRFSDEQYLRPKPMVNVLGKPLIFWVLDNIRLGKEDKIYLAYNHRLSIFSFKEQVQKKYPHIRCKAIYKDTRGAAETVSLCLKVIESSRQSLKTVCLDGDTFYTIDIIHLIKKFTHNGVVSFQDLQDKPLYSYVALGENGQLTQIAEKIKISNLANTGCYLFESAELLQSYCLQAIRSFDEGQGTGELYISSIISMMIKDGFVFHARIVEDNAYHVLGTPYQVKKFSAEHSQKSAPRRFCFDIDNTLFFKSGEGSATDDIIPIERNIEFLKKLKTLGHHIILQTSRGMIEHKGNYGAALADVGQKTFEQLERHEIPYDEIYFGKPHADFFIDAAAISTFSDLEAETGFHWTDIKERNFNSLRSEFIEVFTKSSQDTLKIEGEIHWYESIPSSIVELFPKYFGSKNNEYRIEKIDGLSASILYVNNLFNGDTLLSILNALSLIHKCSIDDVREINIYANYQQKLKKRFIEHDYSWLDDSDVIYAEIMSDMEEYQKKNLGVQAYIHGDPVLTNILVQDNGEIKFIDMRGECDGTYTKVGDVFYDYAKMYQSLLGYDELLHNQPVSTSLKRMLIEIFENYIRTEFDGERLLWIKKIARGLIFSMLPLHEAATSKRLSKLL